LMSSAQQMLPLNIREKHEEIRSSFVEFDFDERK